MNKLGWLLFLFSVNLQAEDLIMSPPLSLDPGPGRTIVEDHAPTGSIVPAKIDPVDGQLKLGEDKTETKSEEKSEEKTPTKEITIAPRQSESNLIEPQRFFIPQKYLQFSFGFLDSKWKKVDSSLENGSTVTDFRLVSDMNEHNQFGFAIEFIQDTSKDTIPENIRVLQYKLFIDHHRPLFKDKLDWMAGLALSIGDFSIRKFTLNSSGEEVYTKLKSGTLYGVIPSAGLRFYLAGSSSIDISIEYHQYLSSPQKHIGGFAFVPRFSFSL